MTVLTHDFWIRRFGADSGIVGRRLIMNGESVTVIGVLQPAPYFPDQVDCFTNMVFSEHHLSATMVEGRTHRMTELIGRLKPNATLDEARTEITTVHERLKRQYPDAYDPGSNYRISVIPFKQAIGQRAQLTLWLLIGVAGFILVITAANVTSLTLMRCVRRGHELVVRTALGAGHARLRRLLLVENLLLALLGAAVGLVIALGGLELLVRLVARYSPRAGTYSQAEPPKAETQLLGGPPSRPGCQTYQSWWAFARPLAESTNQGCSCEVWLSTRSRTTRSPRALAPSRKRWKSSRVPYSGATP